MLSLALLGIVPGVSGARAAGPATLGVMTFNIRTANTSDGDNAWAYRKALVADTIERFAPEIAGPQEVIAEQIEYLAASLPDYRWLGVDRGLNGGEGLSEYTPIFYRHGELSPIESGTFWLSATPDGPTAPVGAAACPGSSRGPASTTVGQDGWSSSSTPISPCGVDLGRSSPPE